MQGSATLSGPACSIESRLAARLKLDDEPNAGDASRPRDGAHTRWDAALVLQQTLATCPYAELRMNKTAIRRSLAQDELGHVTG